MTALVLAAFGLGLALCAPPGVVFAETVRRGLLRGFRAALGVQFGSLVGDGTWAALALGGVALLAQQVLVRMVLGAVGITLLLYLAWHSLRDAWRPHAPIERSAAIPPAATAAPPAAVPAPVRGDFASGAALSLSNPFNIVFWLGVGGGAVSAHVAEPTWVHSAAFLASFLAACGLWSVCMAALVAYGRRFIEGPLFRVVNAACGLVLLYFAAGLFQQLLQTG
ncbi:MAG: hypothetical protein RL635_1251 [Chloroflexota bacterium]